MAKSTQEQIMVGAHMKARGMSVRQLARHPRGSRELRIIDEVGFRALDRLEANLFSRLVSARYEKGSIALTSNKHVRDWPEIFAGDEILTTAILDRLLHHIHIAHIDGRSYRLRELDGLLQQPPAPSPPHPSRKGGTESTKAAAQGA